jgi:pyruvate kinase
MRDYMVKRTKIVATLGPATDNPAMLDKIIEAGVDVVRLNFSHGSADQHRKRVELVRERAKLLQRAVGIIADLQGPKIRIERFAEGRILLSEGEMFTLDATLDSKAGNKDRVGIAYKQLPKDVRKNDILLLDDGRIVLSVKEIIDGNQIRCKVKVGGELSDNKGINRLGGGLSADALTHKDKQDIAIAAELQVDYVAISFPRSAEDIYQARELLNSVGCKAWIIAKIERAEALDNHIEIIRASDAIMVARGDLGVEIGDEALPAAQKCLIKRARESDKLVITATQMMESMINSPIPTRAEVSDVANAVFDGTDAVMLSGETAVGINPDKAVLAMARVCREAEKHPMARTSDHRIANTFLRIDEAIAMSTMYIANHLKVKAIAALTESGATPLWMSRINSSIPIFALSRQSSTCTKMTLFRDVCPINFDICGIDVVQVNERIIRELLQRGVVSEGDLVIITKGDMKGISGGTNMMKIVCVGKLQHDADEEQD